MQAILTKFHGPTNTKPARVSAYAEAGKITMSWDHGLTQEQNHLRAADTLKVNMGWAGELVQGALPGQPGYAFVFLDRP